MENMKNIAIAGTGYVGLSIATLLAQDTGKGGENKQ